MAVEILGSSVPAPPTLLGAIVLQLVGLRPEASLVTPGSFGVRMAVDQPARRWKVQNGKAGFAELLEASLNEGPRMSPRRCVVEPTVLGSVRGVVPAPELGATNAQRVAPRRYAASRLRWRTPSVLEEGLVYLLDALDLGFGLYRSFSRSAAPPASDSTSPFPHRRRYNNSRAIGSPLVTLLSGQ